MTLGVIANPYAARLQRQPELLDQLAGPCTHITQRSADLPKALSALFEAGVSAIAVAGGDGTLSAVVDALAQLPDAPEIPLLPLRCGHLDTVARALRVPDISPHRLLQRAQSETPHVRYVGTLRVVSTLEHRAHLGFNLYTGALYRFLEELTRRAELPGALPRVLLARMLQERMSPPDQDARFLHVHLNGEGEPVSTTASLTWISALARGIVGRAHARRLPFGTPRLHALISETSLAQTTAALALRTTALHPALHLADVGTVTFDLAEGFALDGRFFPAREPYTLHVTPGPRIPVLVMR